MFRLVNLNTTLEPDPDTDLYMLPNTSNQISKFCNYHSFHTKTNIFLGKLRSYIHGHLSSIHKRSKHVGKRPSLQWSQWITTLHLMSYLTWWTNDKPFKIFLIVPLGLLHIDFSPNSLTRVSSENLEELR